LLHGSSTMPLPRMGTSTSAEVHAILASTTPGLDRGAQLRDRAGSTTPAALKAPSGKPASAASSTEHRPLPPQPANAGQSGNDDLGASVLRGFAHLLGF
ncbi:MAG TPA: hypothetical protein VN701_00730, partial [Candidatus Paceibacterota bacterium]|nr:hypothetical protein [Candidatus Paceibacterota bacterium]